MTIWVMILNTKSQTLYKTRFFRSCWNWHLYTKNMKLCITWCFYIQKATQFAKSKTICVTFYIQTSWQFALHGFFMGCLELAEGAGGGGGGLIYIKQCTLRYIFICKKWCTLCYVCIVTLHYIFIFKKKHFA